MRTMCDTVMLNHQKDAIKIIDQALLPNRFEQIELRDIESVYHAIKTLQVRGAPAIGVTAGYAMYLAALNSHASSVEQLLSDLDDAREYLVTARPTAVNLKWAVCRMYDAAVHSNADTVAELVGKMLDESIKIAEEDIESCVVIGENMLRLLKPGMGILTHCNAGALATVRYGTATAAMYLGHERGYGFKIYVDETRPLLQGARLTAYELCMAGMDVTLQCDNMAASLMAYGKVDAVITGADTIAKNGDAANKIGTLGLAVLAKHYNIPLYICAPSSTLDINCACGDKIEIEQRDATEVTDMWYIKPMAPKEVEIRNPAFDVTPAELITAIITERGVYRYPYNFK